MSERIHSACLWQSDFLIARHMAATQVFSNPTLCLLIDDLGSLEGRQWVWVGMYCRDTYTWAGRCWHPVIRPHDRNNMRRVIISLSFLMVGREILGWPAVVATSILASQRSLSALCQMYVPGPSLTPCMSSGNVPRCKTQFTLPLLTHKI